MESKRQFILDTLLPYKQDPTTCGFNDVVSLCSYLTPDGKKCAVGKHLIDGPHQSMCGDVWDLEDEYGLENVLTDGAKGQLELDEWWNMQGYHDNLARGLYHHSDHCLSRLEKLTDLEFPELRFQG